MTALKINIMMAISFFVFKPQYLSILVDRHGAIAPPGFELRHPRRNVFPSNARQAEHKVRHRRKRREWSRIGERLALVRQANCAIEKNRQERNQAAAPTTILGVMSEQKLTLVQVHFSSYTTSLLTHRTQTAWLAQLARRRSRAHLGPDRYAACRDQDEDHPRKKSTGSSDRLCGRTSSLRLVDTRSRRWKGDSIQFREHTARLHRGHN